MSSFLNHNYEDTQTISLCESRPQPRLRHRQPLLTEMPWRKFRKSGVDFEKSIEDDIRNIDPPNSPGILLIGPVGSGKSSFINSCLSVGIGRKKALAKTGCAEVSYTVQFRRYTDSKLLKNFHFMDCMGIEANYGAGFHPSDINFLLQGHVKKDYKFEPREPLTKDNAFYEPNPKFEDKTHCVLFVVDAGVMHAGIPSEYLNKIKCIQDDIKEADVPRVLILTKADKLCDKVNENVSNIFRSTAVQKAVRVASEVFSIEMASIHPVVNYEDNFELTTEQNIPILLALCQILQYASDRVEQVLEEK